MKAVVDGSTGEVQEIPFRTLYGGSRRTGLDYSNPMQKRWKEIPPYAVDIESGKILNKSSVSVLVPNEDFNIDEYIQSFKEDTDIYTILEKFALTGCTDTSIINKGVMSFGDISDLPDNFNDLNEYFDKANKKLDTMSKELAKDILNENKSVESIQKDLADKVEAAKAEAAKAAAAKTEVKKEEVSK